MLEHKADVVWSPSCEEGLSGDQGAAGPAGALQSLEGQAFPCLGFGTEWTGLAHGWD